MSNLSLQAYLLLALVLFCIGLFGALTKRNTIVVLISIELMLNAANINLVAFSKYGATPTITGQVFALFSIALAAAEVAVGMAILLLIFRQRGKVNMDEMNHLHE